VINIPGAVLRYAKAGALSPALAPIAESVGQSSPLQLAIATHRERQFGVQLARSLEANFGIKWCKINGKCES